MAGSEHSSQGEQMESHLYNPGGKPFGTKLRQLGGADGGGGAGREGGSRKKAYLGSEVIKLA